MILKYEKLTFMMSNTISIVDEQDLKGGIVTKLYIGVNLVIFISVIGLRSNCFIMNQQEKQQFQVNC